MLNWGSRFTSGKEKKATRFKQTLDRLAEEKVVLPKNFVYYQKRTEKVETPVGEVKREESKKTVTNESISNNNLSNKNVSNNVSSNNLSAPKIK